MSKINQLELTLKEEVFIICEGQTEEKLINFLEEYYKDSTKYKLKVINAEGKDNILKKYKKTIKLHNHSKFYLIYDLDGKRTIKDILNTYKESSFTISENIIFFVNPECELILCLFKKDNPNVNKLMKEIEKIYNIEEYDKSEKQLIKIFKQIEDKDVNRLIKNLNKISTDDKEIRSTNFKKLFAELFNL